MQIALGFLGLVALWFLVCCCLYGYANTVDHIAWRLHCHACDTRAAHNRESRYVSRLWSGQTASPDTGE